MVIFPEPGDIVGFLDEEGRGTVISVINNTVLVLTDDGIEIPYPLHQIVVYHKVYKENISPKEIPAPEEKNIPGIKKEISPIEGFDWTDDRHILKVHDPSFDAPQKKEELPSEKRSLSSLRDTWEIDLHIHELIDDWRNLSNAEIVEIQLKYLVNFLDKAFTARVPRVIIIHGVGKGVLRDEVRYYLDRFPNIQYFDASYSGYGSGATEARITYGKL